MNIAKRLIKRCSTLLIIREIQTQTKIRYHLTPITVVIIKKKKKRKAQIISVGEDVVKRGLLCTVMGIYIGIVTMENIMVSHQKIKHRISIQSNNSIPGYLSEKIYKFDMMYALPCS